MTDIQTDYDSWAWLYDKTLGPDYCARKMGFLDRVMLSKLEPGGHVLDLCCGTGQMMAPVMAQGFAVTGLDLSADMLRLAGQNAPGATLIAGDARDFEIPDQVDGVVCASASLNHMRNLGDLEKVFRSVQAALKPGGRFVFDINHPAQMARHWTGEPSAGEIRRDYAWLITPSYDPATAVGAFRVDMYRRPVEGGTSPGPAVWRAALRRPILRRLRLNRIAGFARRHADWDHKSILYPVHGHNLDAVLNLLETSGFKARVETFTGSSAVDADSAACFICQKPGMSAMASAAE